MAHIYPLICNYKSLSIPFVFYFIYLYQFLDTPHDPTTPWNESTNETYEFEDQIENSDNISQIPEFFTESSSFKNYLLEDTADKNIVKDCKDMKRSDSGEGDSCTFDVVSDLLSEDNQENVVADQKEDNYDIYTKNSESVFITGSITIDNESVVEDDITETNDVKEGIQDDECTADNLRINKTRDTPEQKSKQEEAIDILTEEKESNTFAQENVASTDSDENVLTEEDHSSILSKDSSLDPLDTNKEIEKNENVDESSSGSTSASSTVTSSFGVWDVNPVFPTEDNVVSSDNEEEMLPSDEKKGKKRSRKRSKALRQSSNEKEE